ncbi:MULTISPECIES: hypothetical protein [Leptospira]|uniref:Thioesterase n=1 Tax=Leptospira levettii TaxID=2023178 RepID=A0AAW5V6B9_9LEPT|nr:MULTISPECIES: hypothetical protein [Leptospira]MCG6142779.1 hypothetical protein [Leptospira mtsangambouensis]MCW7467807.1 hypothetical protein [Leptospira levettii]MCW7513439.1 hypothetical protein [Leptospira levettii]MCW7517175.1 hypothetical protein [Leptospira levettii]
MNYEPLKDFLLQLSYLGTSVSSFLIYLTLREMQKQRKAQVIPVLKLIGSKFSFRGEKINLEYESGLVNLTHNYNLSIVNIGLSIAKDVRITFEYSAEKIKNLLESEKINFRKEQGENQYIIESPWLLQSLQINCDILHNIPYIDPTKEYKLLTNFEIPNEYLRIILLFKEKWDNEKNFEMQGQEIPPLFINIKCYDLLNTEYNFKFKIKFYSSGVIYEEPRSFIQAWNISIENVKNQNFINKALKLLTKNTAHNSD